MAVDTSGKWWVGSQPDDISEFLVAYAPKGYDVTDFRLATCPCGSVEFKLFADDEEGCAKRICAQCSVEHLICDSAEYWTESNPELCVCVECSSDTCNIGAGFSVYEDRGAIRWIYIGERCAKCGVLGCFAGWKVAYTPSMQLMDQV